MHLLDYPRDTGRLLSTDDYYDRYRVLAPIATGRLRPWRYGRIVVSLRRNKALRKSKANIGDKG